MTGPAAQDRDDRTPARGSGWALRIAWFVGLWLASVALLGAVAWIIRVWLVG